MLARIHSAAIYGVDAYPALVEVDVSHATKPSMIIVGLPDAAVRESCERVQAAVRNSGFEFPMERVTVNLAPADIRKEGPAFDLPIALGIILATGQAAVDDVVDTVAATGELSLDGLLRPVSGALPMAIGCRDGGRAAFIVPPRQRQRGGCGGGPRGLHRREPLRLREAAREPPGRRAGDRP